MKQFSTYIALFFLAQSALSAQGYINNGATLVVNNGAHVRVRGGGIENLAAGSIQNNGTLYLDGNYTEAAGASYTAGVNNWLTFENSASVQTITMASVLPKLRVDNNNRLVLGSDLRVANEIDFMLTGMLELGNFHLHAYTAAMNNYSEVGYVRTNGSGTLRHRMSPGDIKEFPVGNSSYNPVILLETGGTLEDTFSVRVSDAVLQNGVSGTAINDHVVLRTWHIDDQTAGNNIVDIALEWGASDEGALFDRANSGIAYHDGTAWQRTAAYAAATNAAGRYTQTRTNQTTFSPFVVESPLAPLTTGLPVELLGLEAERQSIEKVRLDWSTASELNNEGFYIERMIEGEEAFTQVGFLMGAGTTTATTRYHYHDRNSSAKVSYYRLRQVDADGSFSYSPVRAVRGNESSNATASATAASLFPTPADKVLNLRLGDEQSGNMNVRIYDLRGTELQRYDNLQAQPFGIYPIDIAELPAGAYVLQVQIGTQAAQAIRWTKE